MSAQPSRLDPELVESFVANAPADLGRHGIPLRTHAEQGGEAARPALGLRAAAAAR
jgi:hypothetical protein